jgi:hypothetical protein
MTQNRQQLLEKTRATLRTGKLVACFMVGTAVISTLSLGLRPSPFWGGFQGVFVYLTWICNFLAINLNLATMQRLTLVNAMLLNQDRAGIMRFSQIPATLHALALFTFSDPYKLYHPEGRKWFYRR